ncbi:MAG TPA: RluA family pseudouridine synthase [Rectinemataceae bacterium]
MDGWRRFSCGADDAGRRLDRLLRKLFPALPLSAIHRSIRRGSVRVNGEKARPEQRVGEGDIIFAHPGLSIPERVIPESEALKDIIEPRALRIILETPDILFVGKDAGILVHGGENSLEQHVRAYLASRIGDSLSFRPGPLHRLDRNTSGIIAFSKSLAGARNYSRALHDGLLRKTYLAVLEGGIDMEQHWTDSIERDGKTCKSRTHREDVGGEDAGKLASLRLEPLVSSSGLSLVAVRLETGRTHQIRVQASSRGFPLYGDIKYGGTRASRPYWLHAWKLSGPLDLIPLPNGLIVDPLPKYFSDFLFERFALGEKEVYSLLDGMFAEEAKTNGRYRIHRENSQNA